MIQEITNSYTKISPNTVNDNNKDYSRDSEFQSLVQTEHPSGCIDIEKI